MKGTKITGTKTSPFGTKGRINHDSSDFYNSKLYREINKTTEVNSITNKLPDELQNRIILGSAENMSMIPDNSIHLMITSPPYNVSKEYDQDLSLEEYIELLKNVFKETYRVLINGGRACINIANVGRKPYIPLSDYISQIMIEIGFYMRGEIIWNKASSASPSTAWGSWMSASNPILRDIHEYILVFSKGSYKRNLSKEEKKNKKSTISKKEFLEWTKSIWTIKAVSAKKIGHPAPFPIELPYRLIQLYSFTSDIILDPFMGSGTTAIAALRSNRKFIGFEINEKYVRLAEERLKPYRYTIKFK